MPDNGEYPGSAASQSFEDFTRLDVSNCKTRLDLGKDEVYICQSYLCDKVKCPDGYTRDTDDINNLRCKKIVCGEREVLNLALNACECDSTRHWTGEAGNCTCAMNFDEVGDTCKDKKCPNVGEVLNESTGNCECDKDNNWSGDAGSCECAYSYTNNNGVCIPLTCDSNKEKLNNEGNGCVCDDTRYWGGVAGSCTCMAGYKQNSSDECEALNCATGQRVDGNKCVCDSEKHWIPNGSDRCKCDNGYTQESNKCVAVCGKGQILQGERCVCDTDNHWRSNGNSCLCADNYVEINGKCVDATYCKTDKFNYDETTKQCVCKSSDTFLFNNDCVVIGDIITFGKYRQTDQNVSKDDIKWRVLDIDRTHNRMLVISEYVLEGRAYHPVHEDITWKVSAMRSWLNGYGASENSQGIDNTDSNFIKTAFSEDEIKHIVTIEIDNPDNPEYETPGGDKTKDKIFLLSIDEATQYFSSNEDRVAKPTKQVELAPSKSLPTAVRVAKSIIASSGSIVLTVMVLVVPVSASTIV